MLLLGSNAYQRIGGVAGGFDQKTQGSVLKKVVETINNTLKDDYLHFPSEEILASNGQENFIKYKLPNFPWAIDGVHMGFDEKPRKIPPEIPPKDFHNRKLRYT